MRVSALPYEVGKVLVELSRQRWVFVQLLLQQAFPAQTQAHPPRTVKAPSWPDAVLLLEFEPLIGRLFLRCRETRGRIKHSLAVYGYS
jgi:hypothetical protein